MTKGKKRVSSSRKHTPSSPKKKIPSHPPDSIINELVALLNAGELNHLELRAKEAIKQWPNHFIGWKALGILLLMLGRQEEALEPLSNTVKLTPNDSQAHQNLGSAFLGMNRFQEAEGCYRQAISLKSDYFQAYSNLGITLMELGRFNEAKECYEHALRIKPDFFEAYNNLGNTLMNLEHLAEAEKCYLRALDLNPNFAEAHNNLGKTLYKLKRFKDAETCFQQALKSKPGYSQAHCGLANTYSKIGRLKDAITNYQKSIELEPLNVSAHDGLNKVLVMTTALWHVPMMNDRPRNDAYFEALKTAVTSDAHVLEIGTGSGLLAMMAAKLGALKVTTCEAVPEIAETARDIISDNGFTQQVSVIPKFSTKIEVGVDLKTRADLLVSEILSSEFLGEGILSSFEDAKERLLKPGAPIIPARGGIQFALFGGEDIEHNVRVDEVYGFDLSKFNKNVARKQYISRNDLNIELLSDDTNAFFFDFIKTTRFPTKEHRNINVPVRKAGRCCGIIQWIKLEMDDNVVFENHPSENNPSSGWQHCVYLFHEAIEVMPGQIAVISAAHNRNTPWFFFEGMK